MKQSPPSPQAAEYPESLHNGAQSTKYFVAVQQEYLGDSKGAPWHKALSSHKAQHTEIYSGYYHFFMPSCDALVMGRMVVVILKIH